MLADEYCQQKAAASGSSFYYSFLFLPKNKRRAITALYAFCREIDDITDEIKERDIVSIKLEWWRNDVRKIFRGTPEHPVNIAIQNSRDEFEMEEQLLLEIINGMQMDVDGTEYPDFESLRHYCYRVASVVGLLSAGIFGYKNKQTREFAETLGIAFQLTNIIRDVREDAQRQRIYIPAQDLNTFNVTRQQIFSGQLNENFTQLITFQCQRALEYYDKALDVLPDEDRFNQATAIIMAAIYRATLEEIINDNYQVYKQRVRLTPIRKLWIAWRTYRKEKRHYKKWLKQRRS